MTGSWQEVEATDVLVVAGVVFDPVLELVVELDRERDQRLRQRGGQGRCRQ